MAVVTVDASLCTGCGLCTSTCPDAFELNEDNIAQVKNASGAGCDLTEVAGDCPVEAIKISEQVQRNLVDLQHESTRIAHESAPIIGENLRVICDNWCLLLYQAHHR